MQVSQESPTLQAFLGRFYTKSRGCGIKLHRLFFHQDDLMTISFPCGWRVRLDSQTCVPLKLFSQHKARFDNCWA